MEFVGVNNKHKMLIEIESFGTRVLLSGKKYSAVTIKKMFYKVLELSREDDNFTPLFCRTYNYDVLETPSSDNNTQVDYIFDLDTELVLTPSY